MTKKVSKNETSIDSNKFDHELKRLKEIIAWFEETDEPNVSKSMELVKEAASLIKSCKSHLKELDNEFKEIEKEIE